MEKPTKIHTLAGDFEKAALQEYCNSQFLALQKAKQEISQKQLEIDHLKALLTSTTPLVGEISENNFIVPDELTICEIQVQLIKKRGMEKELSLDDTKRLETLVKIMKVIKEQPKDRPKANFNDVPDNLLEAMAAQKPEEK